MSDDVRLRDAEELLRLMVSRLTLAAEGRDPEIDRAARTLREHVRGALDYDALRAELNSISTRIVKLDDLERAPQDAASSVLTLLLEQMPWPDACVEKTKTLLVKWKQEPPVSSAGVDQVVRLIGQCLGSLPSRSGEGKALVEHVVELLLERVDLSQELQNRVEQLRAEIEGANEENDWHDVLQTLADLIAAQVSAVKRQRHELERFLGQMGARLGDLEHTLSSITEHQSVSLDDTRLLGTNMREQVEDFSANVRDVTDLQQLKQTVQGRLDHLLTRVSEYCTREELRSHELEERIQALNSRLLDMENESEQLRMMLITEHAAATTDTLTTLPNRASYEARIKLEFKRWQITGNAFTLIVLDIDNFKRINDTYGHRAGDKALSLLARVMKSNVRDNDFLARHGGEEFVLILPETDLYAAFSVGEKLRKAVFATPFHHRGKRVPLSMSEGITMTREGDDPDKVFERADAAMYDAKQQGRNRCVISQ